MKKAAMNRCTFDHSKEAYDGLQSKTHLLQAYTTHVTDWHLLRLNKETVTKFKRRWLQMEPIKWLEFTYNKEEEDVKCLSNKPIKDLSVKCRQSVVVRA